MAVAADLDDVSSHGVIPIHDSAIPRSVTLVENVHVEAMHVHRVGDGRVVDDIQSHALGLAHIPDVPLLLEIGLAKLAEEEGGAVVVGSEVDAIKLEQVDSTVVLEELNLKIVRQLSIWQRYLHEGLGGGQVIIHAGSRVRDVPRSRLRLLSLVGLVIVDGSQSVGVTSQTAGGRDVGTHPIGVELAIGLDENISTLADT